MAGLTIFPQTPRFSSDSPQRSISVCEYLLGRLKPDADTHREIHLDDCAPQGAAMLGARDSYNRPAIGGHTNVYHV